MPDLKPETQSANSTYETTWNSAKDRDKILYLANAQFDRNYSKLKGIDKRHIFAVLEYTSSHQTTSLQFLVLAILSPDLAIYCNKILSMLKLVASLTESGPVTMHSVREPWSIDIDEVLASIPNIQSEIWSWRYFTTRSWRAWCRDADTPPLSKEMIDKACGLLSGVLYEIWELNMKIQELTNNLATRVNVERIQSIGDMVQGVFNLLEEYASTLGECKKKLQVSEKTDPALTGSIPTTSQVKQHVNPFLLTDGDISNHQLDLRLSWPYIKKWFKYNKQRIANWVKNIQQDDRIKALLILLAINPVVWILLISLPFTVISTLLCETPEDVPVLDSNFHSTVSQTVASLAGLYAIISGLRRPDHRNRKRWKIESKFPRTFLALLCISVLCGVGSVVVYPWQSPWSIPIAFVSNVAQNVATLLIVQGSAQRIKELER